MDIEVTARTDGIPEKAKDYAREKLSKMSRFFDRVGRISVALERGKDLTKAHAVAHLDSGSTLVADTSHEQLRAAIDLLSDKLERQIRREKERLIGRNRKLEPGTPAAAGEQPEDPTYDDVLRDDLEGT